MSVLQIEHLTKDYGHNRGVFDVSFTVEAGEVYGFLGPNGAGKTTTIRHIMGFSRPQKGKTSVNGMDSWEKASEIHRHLGYLPGEIALPESMTGTQFIKMMADLRNMKDMTYTNTLIEKFKLESTGSLKRMSLGMKRKLAIVTAFMHDPAILILDEPTSGLDPIMQNLFIEFIKEEKTKGKTILLSSHIFSEIDATCDKISIIKDGRLMSTFNANDLKHHESKTFKIEFLTTETFLTFMAEMEATKRLTVTAANLQNKQVKIRIEDANIKQFFSVLAVYDVKFISEIKFTLEDYFMKFYERSTLNEGGTNTNGNY